jgi:hypothetical protein
LALVLPGYSLHIAPCTNNSGDILHALFLACCSSRTIRHALPLSNCNLKCFFHIRTLLLHLLLSR